MHDVLTLAVLFADVKITPAAVLSGLTLVAALIIAPRAVKVTALREQLKAKDEVIATRTQTNDALEDRLDVLEAEMTAMREQADRDRAKIVELEREVVEWRTRYTEMQRYAAPEALASVTTQIAELAADVRAALATRRATDSPTPGN